MTAAPEPTAVERTIAEVLRTHVVSGEQSDARPWKDRCAACGAWFYLLSNHQGEAIVAAIRNLPPEQMAQLIGGKVEQAIRYSNSRFYQRAVTPWREVTGPATPARDLTTRSAR